MSSAELRSQPETFLERETPVAEQTSARLESEARAAWRARAGAVWVWVAREAPLFLPLFGLFTYLAVSFGWLCDDAFISFRYARNFAEGSGLVFNLGERVEGYSNFLWVLELAALKRVFSIPPPDASIVLSVAATAGYVALAILLALSTPFRDRLRAAAWITCALLFTNRNVAIWSSSGLETRQFSALVLLGVFFAYHHRKLRHALVYASVAFALAALTRPEGPLLWAGCVLWYFYDARWHGCFRWRGLLGLCAPFLVVLGAQLLFRHAYYGEWFPNTYYAKHVRPWPDAGLHYLTALVTETGLYVLVPLGFLGLFARLYLAKDSLHVLSVIVLGLHALYLVRIGGDHFEFRPFDFYWPLIAIAAADGLLLLSGSIAAAFSRASDAARGAIRTSALALMLGTALAYACVLPVYHDALSYDRETRGETLDMQTPITVDSAPLIALLPFMSETILPAYNRAMTKCIERAIGVRWREHKTFWTTLKKEYGAYRGRTSHALPPDAVMAVGIVGVIPYMLEGVTVIDTKGLTDKVVARNNEPANKVRKMAHDRMPPPGYLDQRGVNFDALPWVSDPNEALRRAGYAVEVRENVWMPFNSGKPDWVRRAFRGRPVLATFFSETVNVSSESALFKGRLLEGYKRLGYFDDGTLNGWVADSGSAVAEQPRSGPVAGQAALGRPFGTGLVNTYHPSFGDGAVGTVSSPEFVAEPRTALAFLMAGGANGVGVELWANGKLARQWTGQDSDHLVPVFVDLAELAGKNLQLRVVDASLGAWGHIVADHFLLMRFAE